MAIIENDHSEDFIIGSGSYLRNRGYVDPDTTRLRFLKECKDTVDREAKDASDDAVSRHRT
jgi:hypothetical protein